MDEDITANRCWLSGICWEVSGSAAEVVEEPEEEREGGAEKEAGDDREVKSRVFAAMQDVAGEAAEMEGEFATEKEKSACEDEEATEEKKSAAEFARGVHGGIVAEIVS